MQATAPKFSLSLPQQRLVELMQSINFGRIEHLSVRNGHPDFTITPRVVRLIKIGGDNGSRLERSSRNFSLKEQIVELFQHFDQLRDGVVDVLEIKHGLPFSLQVTTA